MGVQGIGESWFVRDRDEKSRDRHSTFRTQINFFTAQASVQGRVSTYVLLNRTPMILT